MKALSKSKLVRVEARSLRVHPLAQRELLPSKLKKLMANLDLDAIGVLHAVEYAIDGVNAIWIIDGQHRWRALMEHGLGEWVIEVKIHVDATNNARASELFLKLNDRASVSPYDRFDNEFKAGHDDAVGAAKIVQDNGLKIARSSDDGQLCCVTALKKIYGIDSGATLSRTMRIITSAWGRTASAVEGKLIEGMGIVCGTYNGTLDEPSLIKRLAKYPGGAPALIGDAKGLRQHRKASLSRCVAETVVEVYNSGRRAGKLDPL